MCLYLNLYHLAYKQVIMQCLSYCLQCDFLLLPDAELLRKALKIKAVIFFCTKSSWFLWIFSPELYISLWCQLRVCLELSSCALSVCFLQTPHHIHRDNSAASRTLPKMGKRQASNINLWWQLNPSSWNCEWHLREIIVMGRQQTTSKRYQAKIFTWSWMSREPFLAGIHGKEKSFHLVLENHREWEHS